MTSYTAKKKLHQTTQEAIYVSLPLLFSSVILNLKTLLALSLYLCLSFTDPLYLILL